MVKKLIQTKTIVFTALCVQLFFGTALAGVQTCVEEKRVVRIAAGYIEAPISPFGPDFGNAVLVTFEDDTELPLNVSYNLNDNSGRGLFQLLQTSLVTGLKVSVYDHFPHYCDDFDQVNLHSE